MNPEIKKHIKKYADSKFPYESCGLLVINKSNGEWKFIECENVARDKLKKFAIEDSKFLAALKEGEVIIFHSHFSYETDEKINNFSEEDINISEETCIPFLLYTSNNKWNYYEPSEYEPFNLYERPFLLGFWDCYTFVRDYFKIHGKNSKIRFVNDTDYHYGLKDFDDIGYGEFFEVNLQDIQVGDVIIFKIKSDCPNHLGVYFGNNEFWHHSMPMGNYQSYPKKDILNSKYIKFIHKIVRYNG